VEPDGEGRVVQDLGLNRTTPRTRPLFKPTRRSISPSIIPTLPSCPSSPAGPSRSCGSKFATPTLSMIFLAHLRSPVQTRTASGSGRFPNHPPPPPQTHPDASLLQTFLPSHVLRRQASLLGHARQNSQPDPENLRFILHPCVYPCRHGLLPGLRGSYHFYLSLGKGLPLLEFIQTRYVLDSTVLPRIFRPGPIHQGTQGLQVSVKCTSYVFTQPLRLHPPHPSLGTSVPRFTIGPDSARFRRSWYATV